MIIEYDGTGFHGWQKQPGCRTIQAEIEKAAGKLLGRPVKSVGAGRTDTGVHAKGQAVSLSGKKDFDAAKLVLSMNALLPEDISVVSARQVSSDFNARYDAAEKTYCYRIWNRRNRSVWAQKTSWHVPTPLDTRKAEKTAKEFAGRHDFSAFAASGGAHKDGIAHLKSVKIHREGGFVLFVFEADRFLYRMARNLAGTLVEAGKGKISREQVRKALASGKKDFSTVTAPAQGLFLEEVRYEKQKA